MLLKNIKDINALISAIDKCSGDVILRSLDGKEEFNLKSTLSKYIAIGRLCDDHGEDYEIFCSDKIDEGHMLKFFKELYE